MSNVIDIKQLEHIKNKIEGMTKNHQLEILKILRNNPTVKLNENKSGVYINLSFLPKDTMEELLYYLNYIHDQENSLEKLELQKTAFKNDFFTNE
jgi:hypothetical protein